MWRLWFHAWFFMAEENELGPERVGFKEGWLFNGFRLQALKVTLLGRLQYPGLGLRKHLGI